MSWSRSYSGTPEEVIAAAKADRANIENQLPEFERADVRHVIGAADHALDAVRESVAGAKVTLNINGHGSRSTDGSASGGQGVSISYSLVAPTGS